MRVLVPGHRYELDHLDGGDVTLLQFVDRGHGRDTEGVTCQEVLRALLERVDFLDGEVRWSGNDDIRHHLRMALAGFEARAILRKVEKGRLVPDDLPVSPDDGHWQLLRRI